MVVINGHSPIKYLLFCDCGRNEGRDWIEDLSKAFYLVTSREFYPILVEPAQMLLLSRYNPIIHNDHACHAHPKI